MRRFTEAGITLVPRSVGSCVDLAFRYTGRRLQTVLGLMLVGSAPALAATYAIASTTEYGWLGAIASVALFSPLLGLLLVTDAAAVAFCEPLSPSRRLRVFWDGVPTLLLKGVLRVVALLLLPLIIPSLMLLVYCGFQTESRVLKQFRSRRHEHRTQELVQREYSDLLLRGGVLAVFGGLVWVVLLLTADAVGLLLFDVSPVLGPLAEAGQNPWGYLDPLDVMGNLITAALTDPRLLTTAVGVAMGTYAIIRLAWFFSYVDLRIREDCWDLEVALADEALRWEVAN